MLFGLSHKLLWNWNFSDLCAGVALIRKRFHRDKINSSTVLLFKTNRNLCHYRIKLQFLNQAILYPESIGSFSIQFVNTTQTRNVITLHLTVYSDGLRLNTCYATKN